MSLDELNGAGEAVADTLYQFSLEDETGDDLNGWIYIIRCDEPLSIKIGFTIKDPRKRLRSLQTGCPIQLTLLGWYPGSLRQEQELHQQLAEFRMSGEWFRVDERMSEILAGPVRCAQINNALTGYKP